jgi:uncharacterized membrane protein YeaQ/YmgE (transglycosylase-associated protein family)
MMHMYLALDSTSQIYLFFAVAVLSFFIANTMDGVLGDDGFGVIGNQIITMAGFYLGVILARHFHFPIGDLSHLAVVGLVGSFGSLLVLSISKAILARM